MRKMSKMRRRERNKSMNKKIIIEFSEEELKEIITDYYGLEEEDFDIDDYEAEQIKQILLGN
jgi:hypothetical protein